MIDELVQENATLSLADLELLNALQIAPRASWAALSPVLGVHATTLARRWDRITERGLARVAITPGTELFRESDLAFVELTCENKEVLGVAQRLITDPRLMTIQFIAGSAHLLLTASAANHGLADFLLHTLGQTPGIMHYAARTVTDQLYSAANWRFRALEPGVVAALEALHRQTLHTHGPLPQLDAANRSILQHLSVDGRAGFREIAERTQLSPASVKRRISRLLGSRIADVRCDVMRSDSGHSYSAVLWGVMSSRDVARLASKPSADIPALRMMSLVTGSANIHMVVWLNNPTDLPTVERQLLEGYPGLDIVDRRIVLRTFKYNGARLESNGRISQVLPLAY